MLTISVKAPSGHEQVFLAKEVRFQPPYAGDSDLPAAVFYDAPAGETRRIDMGRIYIMNEAGKTVAHYNLDEYGPPRAAAEEMIFVKPGP